MLAKVAKLTATYTRITDQSTRKGLRVSSVVQLRSLIGQHLDRLGIGSL